MRPRSSSRSAPKPARPSLRARFPWLLLLGVVPACTGDGCTSGCGGITPLPGGFVAEERIENSASLRLTESGLDFLEANIGQIAGSLVGGDGGIVTFDIPQTDGVIEILFFDYNYSVCPGGPDAGANPPKCVAEIDIGNADLSIQPGPPHNITISGVVPLRLQYLPLVSDLCDVDITLNGNDSCPGDQQEFAPIGVTLVISLETDLDPSHTARNGYTRVKIEQVTISQPDIEAALGFCGDGICDDIIDFAKSFVVDQLFGGLQDTLVGTVEDQLCQKASTAVDPPCPFGTNDVNGTCRYGTTDEDACVSMVLGADGHANLSGLLAGISPGTKGGLDFLLAAGGSSVRDDNSGYTWGDLNPINNGASISAFGGVEPNPLSGCVPLSQMARPSGLLIPNELIDDSLITNWPTAGGPHMGLGISESFFNYALSGLYNSGLFCIGITTEQVDLLNSGTIGLLAQSLRDLGIQRETQPIAIVIKPTQPPTVVFGNGTDIKTDPLINLTLPRAGFDFYIMSSDRYIRFMTATFDINAPLNLTVTPEGLVPVLETLNITNGEVDNSELLKEDPAGIAAALQGLLSSQIGGLLGDGLPAVDINGALANLGIKLVIPESVEGQGSPGLRTLVKNNERYLSIFANFELNDGSQNITIDTKSQITNIDVQPEGLRGGTITEDNAPEVTILAEVEDDMGKPVEHQVRVDGGVWRPWTREKYIAIKNDVLRIEGKHTFEVRSRIVGQPYTLDATPDLHEIMIDTVAPDARISPMNGNREVSFDIRDMVSKGATLVRYRFDEGAYSAWIPASDLGAVKVPEEVGAIEVEAKDEGGNVGTARQEIIRGLPRGDGGCGCVLVGTENPTTKWPIGLLGAGLLGMFIQRRRASARKSKAQKRSLTGALLGNRVYQGIAGGAVLAVAGTFSGCSCDETDTDPPGETKCEAPGCVTLEPGLIGSYTSADVDSKNAIWVAGYLEANYEQAFPNYGDLVVGKVNENKVEWEIIDGVPKDPPPDPKTTNVEGFRDGQTAPGDDVGIWTSLAINPSTDSPAVSYYDRTNKALKFAEFNGTSWTITVVRDEPEADVGRYSKLVFDGTTPVIAFMTIEPSSDGLLKSGVRIARGNAGGFAIEEVSNNASTPCRDGLCTGGSKCVADDGVCASPGSGCDACEAGTECVNVGGASACKELLTTPRIEAYPNAAGLYVTMAKLPDGGLGIAYYDRIDGSLNVAAKESSGWVTNLVDGGLSAEGIQGDAGLGASLFIDDSGTWHLSYVDGYNETVKYARVVGGVAEVTEVVDEGFGVDGVAFPDGQHVVGDDSNIFVTPQGSVQITYQDASNGTLHLATGTSNATGGHDWSVKVLASDSFGGFFSRQVQAGGALKVVHWGRKIVTAEDGVKKGVGDVELLTP